MKLTTTIQMMATMALVGLVHCGSAQKITSLVCPDGGSTCISSDETVKALKHYQSADSLLGALKEQLSAQSREYLNIERFKYCDYIESTDSMPVASPSTESSTSTAADFTPTNLQEKDVDEPDTVKTDGQHVYVAIAGGVDIFKAWPLDSLNKVATIQISDKTESYGATPQFFLFNQRLLVLHNSYSTGDLQISLYDVTNPKNPSLLRQKTIEGSYTSARLINRTLHLAFLSALRNVDLEYNPDIDDHLYYDLCSDNGQEKKSATDKVQAILDAALQSNEEKIAALTLDQILPRLGSSSPDKTISWTDIATDGNDESSSLAGLYSMQVTDTESSEMVTLVKGSAYQVYASTGAFYLTGADWGENVKTNIHRFALQENGKLHVYTASGSVPGYALNQFSMSEYRDAFRIATTSDSHSNAYVLDAKSESLAILGKTEDLAEGEQIYAARFIGDRGYLVTFKQIDPFFVLDLKNPKSPQVLGELKMPGFSTYLHPLDENHIIGLGMDVDDQGDFSWSQGLKLATFDVTTGATPAVVDEEIIGGAGTSSEALHDHHAFTFDAESGLLALPVGYYEDYGTFLYSGVHLYRFAKDGTIATEAVIKIPDDQGWYNPSPSRTILLHDDKTEGIIILDDEHVYAVDLDKPDLILKTVDLTIGAGGQLIY